MVAKVQFSDMFSSATGHAPYPYQQRLADSDELPSLLSVPTGLGKTAATVLAWIWRRHFADAPTRHKTPRRLVYCLPMRVLVEQTRDCAVTWLDKLGLLGGEAEFDGEARVIRYDRFGGDDLSAEKIRVHLLMGGDVDRDWDMYPEREAIIIGTQDMLLSRALNRGYAMSRFRWPIQYALLNNDCLWVMDEVQLMGSGLATTAQLQAFRRKLGAVGPGRSLWMSATMDPGWLSTVDFDAALDAPGSLEISDADRQEPRAKLRLDAKKPIEKASFDASEDGKAEADLADNLHQPGTRTLVVVNTVRRAQNIYRALLKKNCKAQLTLLHSRFRQADREKSLAKLLHSPGPDGTIAVSTQVVEAGVDVSATLLITDLAPWSSMVQRFGRCNREGSICDALVVWIEPADLNDDKKLKAAPYTPEDLRTSANRLATIRDAGPSSLPLCQDGLSIRNVVRRKDVIELFDTTPDLAGADIDVSRFIRESDDHDLQGFWRDVDGGGPVDDEPGPRREELCRVPVSEMDLRERTAWRWDHLEKGWQKARTVFPGLVLMLRAEEGGYSTELGWTSTKGMGGTARTEPVRPDEVADPEDSNDCDSQSSDRRWVSIAEHTESVLRKLESLLRDLGLDRSKWADPTSTAACWHDVGKAHEVFQAAMPDERPPGTWAKSAGRMKRYARPGFRHELASALAMLAAGLPDLAAYLAAAHHGKVRLSIRSLPHEKHPGGAPERLFARGIWDGDMLPSTDLGGGVAMPETRLMLSFMEMGEDKITGESWLSRMLALRDDPQLGPFRLAFLEALLRIADWRASGNTLSHEHEEKA